MLKPQARKGRPRSGHPADVELGRRIREIRLRAGVSQQAMAEAVGVSYQQIQKYERGSNRVTAVRLELMAAKLSINVTDFWSKKPIAKPTSIIDMKDKNALALVRAFSRITGQATKRRMVELIEALAETG